MNWKHAARVFSAIRVCIWIAVLPLSILFGWIGSVVFVSVCSIYANLASDYAAFRSEIGEDLDRIEAKLDRLLDEHS